MNIPWPDANGPSTRRGWSAALRTRCVRLWAVAAVTMLVVAPVAAPQADDAASALQQLERDAARSLQLDKLLNDTIGSVQGSIGKCLAEARKVGDNEAVRTVLRNIARKPGQQYFNLSFENVLGRLERAAGRKLDLTAFDLQTCVLAYDMHFTLTAHTDKVLTNPAIGCQPGQNFCQGTIPGAYVCCSGSTPICAQSCDEDGDCEPYCEPSLSCFPGEATVAMADGSTRRMDELRIGDRVAVMRPDGTRGFDEIYLFTHKDAVATNAYRTLTLESGRELTLSPRHFIPVATDGGAGWDARVVKAAEEVGPGDVIWYENADGSLASAAVTAVATQARQGLFNPLTMGGTILVDGVVASAHSDWFLDGIASPATQDVVYQALFLPVRALYRLIGPEWTETVAERWGVVDAARDASFAPWAIAAALGCALLLGAAAVGWRKRRTVGG